MNDITLSYDQNTALRDDGMRLVAVERIPDGPECCAGCAAMEEPRIGSCHFTVLRNRRCQSHMRKDRRYIRWEALK